MTSCGLVVTTPRPCARGRMRRWGKAMVVRCNWCFVILEQPGALVFTPPDLAGQCEKIHVCVDCYERFIQNEPSAGGGYGVRSTSGRGPWCHHKDGERISTDRRTAESLATLFTRVNGEPFGAERMKQSRKK